MVPNPIGLMSLSKEEETESVLSTHMGKVRWGHSEKVAVCKLGRELPPETSPDSTLVLVFEPPELWGSKFPLFKPPGCGIWQPEETDMALDEPLWVLLAQNNHDAHCSAIPRIRNLCPVWQGQLFSALSGVVQGRAAGQGDSQVTPCSRWGPGAGCWWEGHSFLHVTFSSHVFLILKGWAGLDFVTWQTGSLFVKVGSVNPFESSESELLECHFHYFLGQNRSFKIVWNYWEIVW